MVIQCAAICPVLLSLVGTVRVLKMWPLLIRECECGGASRRRRHDIAVFTVVLIRGCDLGVCFYRVCKLNRAALRSAST